MNGLCQLALKADIPEGGGSTYVHPTTKQCNYTYKHPSTKQCNYSVSIINNLTSSSTSAALSANQGRLLNQKIAELENKIEGSTSPTVVGSGTDRLGNKSYTITSCKYVELEIFTSNGSRASGGTCSAGGSVRLRLNSETSVTFTLNSSGTELTADLSQGYAGATFNWVAYG